MIHSEPSNQSTDYIAIFLSLQVLHFKTKIENLKGPTIGIFFQQNQDLDDDYEQKLS